MEDAMNYTWKCQKCETKVVIQRKISEYNNPPSKEESRCECSDYRRVECEGTTHCFKREKGNYNSHG